MSKALIIGKPNSIHTVNFLNSILIKNPIVNEIDLFSTDHNDFMQDEYRNFYKHFGVNIISTNSFFQNNTFLKRIDYLIRKTWKMYSLLSNVDQYDYCFVLYCSEYSAIWSGLFAKKFKKLIPVFWGGDVLRNDSLNNLNFKKMLMNSYKVVMPNENSLRVFNKKTRNAYMKKVCVIQYPQNMVKKLKEIEAKKYNKNEIKINYKLPLDKKIVICGHTATRAENYKDMIYNLELCNDSTINDCFFVFMMTYAPEEHLTYQKEVFDILENSKLNGIIFKDFLPYEEVLKLHFISDIHITAIKTDAFSCFLQEELYSGSILLYGRWLNYYEIENDNFFAIPFDCLPTISNEFEKIFENFSIYKEKSKCNRKGIIDIASEEAIIHEWNKIILDN